jgi:hypothetical protein
LAPRLRPRLLTLFAATALLTTVCSPTNAPVASSKPPHEEAGGGVPGGSATDGGSLPDGSLPDGSTAPGLGCYLCGGSADLDAGCPTNWTATEIVTQTASVCVCENNVGATGCQFCSDANPANGGCDDAGACTDICAPGGYFSLCVPLGVTVPDECYITDGG